MTTPEEIKKVDEFTCKAFGINLIDIRRKCRTYPYADARQMIWKVLKETFGYKTCELGRLYERDHGAITHGVKAITGKLTYDIRLQSKYKYIKEEIKRG